MYLNNSEFHNINALYELKIHLPVFYIFFMRSIDQCEVVIFKKRNLSQQLL